MSKAATVKRGDNGEEYPTEFTVETTDYDLDTYGVEIAFDTNGEKWAFPLTIKLGRSEATLLCAYITARLSGMAICPPKPAR